MKSFSCRRVLGLAILLSLGASPLGMSQAQAPSAEQLARWLKRFPEADTDKDGSLTLEEAIAYRQKMLGDRGRSGGGGGGAPRDFKIDPGWDEDGFPEHAVSLKSAAEIKAVYAEVKNGRDPAVTSFEKPADGALRIVGTGHSFMAPGYKTLPRIVEAAGYETQPLFTHTGGGMTGSTRYKWEQENGIFDFDGKPMPKLLASIANAEWDVMTWGPYFKDRPEFYACWIDFCLKYQPEMKFYLSDAWLQLYQLDEIPTSEDYFTDEVIDRLQAERGKVYVDLVETLRKDYPGRVFIMPTCEAMGLAGKAQRKGELPGIEGFHKVIGGKERSLWRDQLGHLGPGLERLEGYVFYATLYGKSPELIEEEIDFRGTMKGGDDPGFPNAELDRKFREIAWQAVIANPYSGVKDENGDGVKD